MNTPPELRKSTSTIDHRLTPGEANTSVDSTVLRIQGSLEALVIEDQEPPAPEVSRKATALMLLKKYWFLLGLFTVILLAAFFPYAGSKEGPLHTDITVGYLVTSVIFFLSGIGIETKVLRSAFTQWRLLLFVQFFSLGVCPITAYLLTKLLRLARLDSRLCDGIIICCCTPTTIASNVIMTKQANGNESASLVNAVVGNMLGVFLSPILIVLYLGESSGSVALFRVFIQLGITVLGPLIIGQLFRYFLPRPTRWILKTFNLSYLNSSMLLILVWSVFSDTFEKGDIFKVPWYETIIIMVIDVSLFSLFSGLLFLSKTYFSKPDTIAAVMCGATKTVALGIPLISVIFKNNPDIGILSIPLLMYHALQLITGALLVFWLRSWNK